MSTSCYLPKVSDVSGQENRPLRLATCGRCKAKLWIPDDLPQLEMTPCSKCGHSVIIPTRIRNFEVREVVASGGMGTVFRAFDVTLERIVALKMLKKEMAQDKQVMESFHREARAMAALNHTNIIHIYSTDEFNGAPFLVMELADSGTLDGWIEREGVVPELSVLDIGIKVGYALESALQRGLLHRDIKPGNILFNEYNEPKLVDFGLARLAEQSDEYEATIWGTPYYVAPEKIQRRGEDFRSDLYSFGGTLYHALTGHVPFEAETAEQVVAAHVHTPLTPPILVRPEVSQYTSDALVRAMAKEPDHRYGSYGEFCMVLEASRSHLLIQMQQHQERPAPARPARAHGRSWWKR